ncbi:MAG: twin-arginine translocase TatA/TatE family subunit [Actinomycetota bacterium]|nr:twin-arginine translocase TatA/TatE family subunit [Actinomycetota bacterium]
MIGDILQPTHLLFILVIALLVLGPKRLPEVGRSLGRGLRDFKDAISGEDRERHDEVPSYTSPETMTPPSEPPAPHSAGHAGVESSPPSSDHVPPPSDHLTPDLVTHPSAPSSTQAGEPADAELVSHPNGESAGSANEPAQRVH